MYTIKTTPEFDKWISGIRDGMRRLAARLRKAQLGNLGDVKPVDGEVFEMRGEVVVLMLGGGDKSTQASDISRAVKMAAAMEG